jgi:NTP pyrophosphatase (non-canonical NTP hydrolase)
MKKLEQDIKQYLEERGWDKLKPGDVAKSISIEAGELLELFQWENPSLDEVKNNPEKVKQIEKELADIMTYCSRKRELLED